VNQATVVGVLEGFGNIVGEPKGVVDRQLAFSVEPISQRLALDVRHYIVLQSGLSPRVQQGHDVGMLQPPSDGDLSLESLAHGRPHWPGPDSPP